MEGRIWKVGREINLLSAQSAPVPVNSSVESSQARSYFKKRVGRVSIMPYRRPPSTHNFVANGWFLKNFLP